MQRNKSVDNPEVEAEAVNTDPLSDTERAYLTLLFNKYRGSLHRYLGGLVRSTDDAAELVQETYFRVMRHTRTMQFESVARSYLFQTATNLAREYYRRNASHRTHLKVDLEEAAGVASEELTPEQFALWDEAIAKLKTALAEMPPRWREVYVLHRFEHQTYPQIAAVLCVSTRTVERRMSQALDFLIERTGGAL